MAARIAGIDLPIKKKIEYGLTYVYGIGLHTSQKILAEAKVDKSKRVNELTDSELRVINEIVDKKYQVEGELKQQINKNIRRLKDIKCYRGIRHKLGLPVRGQRTRNNAVTRKGKNIAIGGLNPKVTKT
ncbi:30S ribosomal protein S13 [Candidatus Dojkabacteria bacterium]|nr:30S ribosomal protein S13 [Candidatus Dojkabacteria bacterium]